MFGLILASLLTLTFSDVHIVDGDTFKYNGESYRTTQWDTPEYYMSMKMAWDSYHVDQSTRDIRHLGSLASTHFKFCVMLNNIEIQEVTFQSRRKYVTVQDELVDCMVKEGYAYPNDNDPENSSLNPQVISYVDYAKAQKLGLWGIDFDLMDKLFQKSVDNK